MCAARLPSIFVKQAGELCESPLWDARTQQLYWVDIPAGTVHSASASGDRRTWELGTPVGAIARRSKGGWIAALARGVRRYDDDWSADGPVTKIADQPADTRFNDAAVDPRGRLWAGTLSERRSIGRCSLYRIDAAMHVTPVLTGITTSNGLGWSPDGRKMYYVDTGVGIVWVLTFDQDDDQLLDKRPLVVFGLNEGWPDGLAVDTDGCVWIALWGGGSVQRLTPTGKFDREFRLPVSRVSSVAFGGSDSSTLFITTAVRSHDERPSEPERHAGSIFALQTDAQGVPVGEFAG
jgi:sugar lactone lactonase YvrE